ncbi:MAG: CGGC domain-containing protein [Chloroflexota bacterium]|nr:CGGC domain-containing protein [Chloroflexota bacterium]
MTSKPKIGVIVCDCCRRCAGGKILQAMKNREGAFSIYADQYVELVGYITSDGCPGGNIEYTGDEMALLCGLSILNIWQQDRVRMV